ncbi:MAG: DUF167 domain-containing protein [bacterium]|nr:DUF167 domain-containing protein [bacterium]
MKIFVKAKPGANKEYIKKISETNFVIEVTEPPKKGKANKAIVRVLKEYFGKEVRLVSGFASRQKVFEIE